MSWSGIRRCGLSIRSLSFISRPIHPNQFGNNSCALLALKDCFAATIDMEIPPFQGAHGGTRRSSSSLLRSSCSLLALCDFEVLLRSHSEMTGPIALPRNGKRFNGCIRRNQSTWLRYSDNEAAHRGSGSILA